MRINTFMAAAVIAGAGLCVSAPVARAADETKMNGVYTYVDEDGVTGTWIINTTCTPGCVAHVGTSLDSGFDAQLVNGRYTVTRTVPEGAVCPDNSSHPVTVNQSWDPATLIGEVDFLETSAPCGLADPHDYFSLTRIG
ncbi:hypothetical protein BN1232_04435 [Mycobacterium rhizamassiliense]|jgi:hypothetical protein|uniref:Lipoprotein n=1 Tax=Mycobacterium rhizamassiliense TaxID=1841860 RepID=A0A2U3NVX8_9MYCO|nr:hypothetical protein [Mycobacterium rhizamassiliense]SPM35605.1 hypothetical protein BN1232_04435 [Mycobacterium rhizamassiliense]